MTRRLAILTCFLIPLGSWRALNAQAGRLMLRLDAWAGLDVTYNGEMVRITSAEIFNALKGRD